MPAGHHAVRLTYQPEVCRVGIFLGLAACAALAGLWTATARPASRLIAATARRIRRSDLRGEVFVFEVAHRSQTRANGVRPFFRVSPRHHHVRVETMVDSGYAADIRLAADDALDPYLPQRFLEHRGQRRRSAINGDQFHRNILPTCATPRAGIPPGSAGCRTHDARPGPGGAVRRVGEPARRREMGMKFAGYSRREPEIRIHLFVRAENGDFVAHCGYRMPKPDLIDAEGLGDDEPLVPGNPHLCPACLPALARWASKFAD